MDEAELWPTINKQGKDAMILGIKTARRQTFSTSGERDRRARLLCRSFARGFFQVVALTSIASSAFAASAYENDSSETQGPAVLVVETSASARDGYISSPTRTVTADKASEETAKTNDGGVFQIAGDLYNEDDLDAETKSVSHEETKVEKDVAENVALSPDAKLAALDADVPRAVEYEIIEGDDSDRLLFPNLRPFKRARERLMNARTFVAPPPPSVEESRPIAASPAPILTKENANLPPLGLDDSGVQEVATKSELEKLCEETKGLAWKKGDFKIVPYGFLNVSVSSDSQRAVPGEFILYAQSPEIESGQDFAVDARTSRLGLNMEGPRVESLNADLRGQVEFDFQGVANGSKNKGGLQLRRAFVELNDKARQRRFLFGQDWEIISPVAPEMLNYLPAGFIGDMQYRRAQVRMDQGWTVSSDLSFIGQIAVCDNVLGDYLSTAGVTASPSGWPILEMRVGTSLFEDSRNGLPIKMGVSGHIGEQNYRFSSMAGIPMASTSERVAVRTWSTNFDMDIPLTEVHKLQGEYYIGSNLSSFCGGINQGVDLYRREGIRDSGGWLALHSGWTPKFSTNVGYSIDKPEDDDLVGTSVASNGITTSRTRNEIYFVNFIYKWTPNLMTGLETSYLQTDYKKADVSGSKPVFLPMDSGKTCRFEFVTRLSF